MAIFIPVTLFFSDYMDHHCLTRPKGVAQAHQNHRYQSIVFKSQGDATEGFFFLPPTGKSVYKYACIVRSFLLCQRHDITSYFMVDFIYNVTPSVYHFPDLSSFPPPTILKSLSLQQLHPPPPSPFFGPGCPIFRKVLWICF